MILRHFKITILSSFLFVSISCSQKVQEPFSFVQLCDTQLGMGGYEHDIRSFEQAVKQINEINPDFAVICGDLVNNASDSSYFDFKRIMKGFQVPCYPAPGNHDVGNIPNDTTLNYYRKTIGKDYYTFQNKGYSFIVTNTQLWKINVKDESEIHDSWFKHTLDSLGNNNTSVIVIGHFPIFLEFPDEEEVYFNLPLDKRKDILALFESNKVKAYLSGHKHETVINSYENIQLVSGETTSKNFDGRPLGFRLWEVSTDTILHRFVPLEALEEEKYEED
ncbi:MAG: metallophosphoesterase [Cyclobacteriaceae bacterium]|nr:metallophosphoesterase [Cyclobacteriaceae bacterium]